MWVCILYEGEMTKFEVYAESHVRPIVWLVGKGLEEHDCKAWT